MRTAFSLAGSAAAEGRLAEAEGVYRAALAAVPADPLFRQPRPGDWESVVADARRALADR